MSEPCARCGGEGLVRCRAHLLHKDSCFFCWNGEPCPDCQPDLAFKDPRSSEPVEGGGDGE